MSRVAWKGVTTHGMYQFDSAGVPAAYLNPAGGYMQTITINAETAIFANTDGSVARGMASGANSANPYAPVVIPSAWEEAQQP